VQEKVKIKILRGTESDIVADGHRQSQSFAQKIAQREAFETYKVGRAFYNPALLIDRACETDSNSNQIIAFVRCGLPQGFGCFQQILCKFFAAFVGSRFEFNFFYYIQVTVGQKAQSLGASDVYSQNGGFPHRASLKCSFNRAPAQRAASGVIPSLTF